MIVIENISVAFGKKKVLDNFSCTFGKGIVSAVTGESGCGKSTLLNVIAGLISPSSGSITNRCGKLSYVFQEPRLFEWMTAAENVATVINGNKTETKATALYYLDALGLADCGDRYPSELSGGMKQRVSIARALAYKPEVLLLDEPFKALDASSRNSATDFLLSQMRGKTVIMATHDEIDLRFSDCVYSLSGSPVKSAHMEKCCSLQTE